MCNVSILAFKYLLASIKREGMRCDPVCIHMST